MYASGTYYTLTLKNKKVLNRIHKDYRPFDVCLLNYLVFDRVLKVNPKEKQRIIFSANERDLVKQADIEKNSVVFFLQSAKINDIIYLAKKGKKMPPKNDILLS